MIEKIIRVPVRISFHPGDIQIEVPGIKILIGGISPVDGIQYRPSVQDGGGNVICFSASADGGIDTAVNDQFGVSRCIMTAVYRRIVTVTVFSAGCGTLYPVTDDEFVRIGIYVGVDSRFSGSVLHADVVDDYLLVQSAIAGEFRISDTADVRNILHAIWQGGERQGKVVQGR